MPSDNDALDRAVRAYQEQLEQGLTERLMGRTSLGRLLADDIDIPTPGGGRIRTPRSSETLRYMGDPVSMDTIREALEQLPPPEPEPQQRRFFTGSQMGPWVIDRPERPSYHNYWTAWTADFGAIEPRVAVPVDPIPLPDYFSSMRDVFRSGAVKVERPSEVSYEKLYDPILIKLLMEHVEPTIEKHIADNLWMLQHFHGVDLDLTVRKINSLEKVNNKPPDRYRLSLTYSPKSHTMSLIVEEDGKVKMC